MAAARRPQLDFALLQTSFLGEPSEFSAAAFLGEADGLAVGLSWGGPEGLAFGERADALRGLVDWLEPAARSGSP